MASRTGQVLLVAGDSGLAALVAAAAKAACCLVSFVDGTEAAAKLTAKKQFDLILFDANAVNAVDLDHFLATDPANQGKLILIGNPATARPRHACGGTALECIPGSVSLEALTRLMEVALLRTPSHEIQAEGAFSGMIGRTPRMQALFANIRRVAPLDVGVLVHGESGTGKELVARALHTLSRRSGQFVAVNCGAVAPDLLSSQLFGHERGSFTGATQSHAGFFEQANGGTLFLDEISEMPVSLQVYLLRVIESRALTRVGGSREIAVDVRVIAASNRDLQRAVAAGELRQDLYFRLLEFPLTIPPLRERREDIPALALHFVALLNSRYGTNKRIGDEALHQLSLRTWPGNVRELLHEIQRLYILTEDGSAIDVQAQPEEPLLRRATDVPGQMNGTAHARSGGLDGFDGADAVAFTFGMTLDDIERKVLLNTLAHCHADKREAARILGVSLKTIYNKLMRYRTLGLIDEATLHDPGDAGRRTR